MDTHTASPDRPARFRHQALLYDDPDEFVAGVAGFVRAGLDRQESVLAALVPEQISAARAALGRDASRVEFVDMARLGGNPARIIPAWSQFAERQVAAGRAFRGVGEPIWAGRRPAEIPECQLHEQLLNAAFDRGPGWLLLCPYDTARLPEQVIAGARRSHPELAGAPMEPRDAVESGPAVASADYDAALLRSMFAAELPDPTAPVEEIPFGAIDIPSLREKVAALAAEHGLSRARADELVLAANEVATNSVRYGGGAGLLRGWRETEALVLEFRDRGRIEDPLAGRVIPPLGREGGRGLFLVNQLCDFVQLRSGPNGTVVRITTRL